MLEIWKLKCWKSDSPAKKNIWHDFVGTGWPNERDNLHHLNINRNLPIFISHEDIKTQCSFIKHDLCENTKYCVKTMKHTIVSTMKKAITFDWKEDILDSSCLNRKISCGLAQWRANIITELKRKKIIQSLLVRFLCSMTIYLPTSSSVDD